MIPCFLGVKIMKYLWINFIVYYYDLPPPLFLKLSQLPDWIFRITEEGHVNTSGKLLLNYSLFTFSEVSHDNQIQKCFLNESTKNNSYENEAKTARIGCWAAFTLPPRKDDVIYERSILTCLFLYFKTSWRAS